MAGTLDGGVDTKAVVAEIGNTRPIRSTRTSLGSASPKKAQGSGKRTGKLPLEVEVINNEELTRPTILSALPPKNFLLKSESATSTPDSATSKGEQALMSLHVSIQFLVCI